VPIHRTGTWIVCAADDEGKPAARTGMRPAGDPYPLIARTPGSYATDEDNARLIAAAPEMAEALDLVLLFHSGGGWTSESQKRWMTLTGSGDATTRVMCDAVRAALRKAGVIA
jgi:hypothetical protein